jgi:hypothetical protein
MPAAGGDGLASVAGALAGLTAAARAGGLDETAALTALAAARRIAAELEHSELALIEAARDSGATWTRIAAAMGARNRQTAQKRHADLDRRHPRPPSVDTPAAQPRPQDLEARRDGSIPEAEALVDQSALPKSTSRPSGSADRSDPDAGAREPAGLPPAAQPPAPVARRHAVPGITGIIIAEGRYELVRAPGHAETRAWHVMVGGRLAGLVRPTWRGERSRPGWEPAGLSGLALPVKGTGRTTPAGNARTRDAAAVSLLRALQRQQEEARKKAGRDPASTHAPFGMLSEPLRHSPAKPLNSPLRTPPVKRVRSSAVKSSGPPRGSAMSRTTMR